MDTNKQQNVDWREMSKSTNSRELDSITRDVLDSQSCSFVESVREQVDDELYVVATDARKAADAYWDINNEMRETGDPAQQGYFGTRTRVVNNSLDAHWYKNRFTPSKGANNKKGVLSQHVEKGKGNIRYPAQAFKGAKDWEKEAITVTENRYELLRKRSAALSKIRRALAEYERLVEKCYRG